MARWRTISGISRGLLWPQGLKQEPVMGHTHRVRVGQVLRIRRTGYWWMVPPLQITQTARPVTPLPWISSRRYILMRMLTPTTTEPDFLLQITRSKPATVLLLYGVRQHHQRQGNQAKWSLWMQGSSPTIRPHRVFTTVRSVAPHRMSTLHALTSSMSSRRSGMRTSPIHPAIRWWTQGTLWRWSS